MVGLDKPFLLTSAVWYTFTMWSKDGGMGKCNRRDAIRSPGASNATVGAPNVAPTKLAKEPPSECPITQIFAFGYMNVTLLYKFWNGCNE